MTHKNKGFSKPAVLTLSAAAVAAAVGFGYFAYTQITPQNDITITRVSSDSVGIESVDFNDGVSIAAALYNSVLTENFSDVPELVDKLREFEFKKSNNDANISISDMTEEELSKPLDITKYLSNSAVKNLDDKIQYMSSRLTASQFADTYKFYLNALINIFSFYEPSEQATLSLGHSIQAYKVFKENTDYTLGDIRALYGPTDALRLCRYLIGTGDYSRISSYEIKYYMIEEIQRLIKTIPVNVTKDNSVYTSSDFANLTPNSINDIKALNYILPSLISFMPKIDGIKKDDLTKEINSIKENFNRRINQAVSFSSTAQVFYECQATTSELFAVKGKPTGKKFKNVALYEGVYFDAIEFKFSEQFQGCGSLDLVFVLIPSLEQYTTITNSLPNLTEENQKQIDEDIKLLTTINNAKAPVMSIGLLGSEVAAKEANTAVLSQAGRFTGTKDFGILYNLNLPSFKLLSKLRQFQRMPVLFEENAKNTDKREQAIYKLNIVDDLLKLENHLASLNFENLLTNSGEYLTKREKELVNIDLNFKNLQSSSSFNIQSTELASNNSDDTTYDLSGDISMDDNANDTIELASATNEESPEVETTTQETVEIAQVETKPEPKVEEVKETTEVAQVETKPETKPEPKVEEVAQVETKPEPKAEEVKETTEVAQVQPSTPQNEQVSEVTVAPLVNFMTAKELAKANINDVITQAEAKNPDALFEYGYRLMYGQKGASKNVKKAYQKLEEAANLNNGTACYMLANLYKKDRKASNAQKAKVITYLKTAAEQGVPDAMVDLGIRHLEGNEVKKDFSAALELFTNAAEKDNSRGQYQLAKMFIKGLGVEKNIEKGYNLMISAAKNNGDAAYELAKIYEGELDPAYKDERAAIDNYVIAARKGNKKAYMKAGLALVETKTGNEEGIKYLLQCEEKDNNDVQNVLLDHYIKTNNTTEIAKLISKAPADVQEQYPVEMGDLYLTGKGVTKNIAKAEEFYRKGTTANKPEAFCRIADMYYKGIGKSVDMVAAMKNYTKGADLGSQYCSKQLAIIKITQPNQRQLEDAFQILNSLPQNEMDKQTKSILALMYLYGQGTRKDENEGIKLLDKIKSKTTQFIRTIHSTDSNTMSKEICSNPIYAGILAQTNNNINYMSLAALGDPYFYKPLRDQMNSISFDVIYKNASNVCKSIGFETIFDAKPTFKRPTNERTNNIEEIYQLGMHYFADKNFAKAFELIREAADNNHPKAKNNLGMFYLLGVGTNPNPKEAYQNLMAASSAGLAKASFNVAALRKYGVGTKAEHEKSNDLLNMAISKGYSLAAMHAAYSYDHGYGNQQNNSKAFDYMVKLVLSEK